MKSNRKTLVHPGVETILTKIVFNNFKE